MKIGEKIRWLRIKNSLTQAELADRCELSKGFISQIERDLTSPSIATLVDLLECLGTNLQEFFSEPPTTKCVFTKEDIAVKVDEELGHEIQWVIPNAQKNDMEPIIITIQPGGQSPKHDPHEGEEFGYVLKGRVQLVLGTTEFRLKKGESFYFQATVPHFLRNVGKSEAQVLWVSSPPSF